MHDLKKQGPQICSSHEAHDPLKSSFKDHVIAALQIEQTWKSQTCLEFP